MNNKRLMQKEDGKKRREVHVVGKECTRSAQEIELGIYMPNNSKECQQQQLAKETLERKKNDNSKGFFFFQRDQVFKMTTTTTTTTTTRTTRG